MKKMTLLHISIAAALLAGCSSTHSPDYRKAHDRVVDVTDKTFEEKAKLVTPERGQIGKIHSGVAYHDVNSYSLVRRDERKLPSEFMASTYLKDKEKQYTVDEFSALIYRANGITLDVSSPDLRRLAAEITGAGERALVSPLPVALAANSLGVIEDSAGQYDVVADLDRKNTLSDNRAALKLKPFTFKGNIKDMLDYVALLNGLKWRYDANSNKAYLYVKDTREFMIHDFGANRQLQNSISTQSQSESDSTSGGSSMQYSSDQSVDAWKQVVDSISGMVSEGDKVSANQKGGLVLVTADDHTLARIDSYVRKINDITSKPISLQYRMVRVKYNESDFKGINHNYLNTQLKNGAFGNFSMEAGMGNLSANIAGNTGTMASLAQGNYLALANDSFQALMGFLNTVGTAELSYETHVIVPNNEVYSHQGGKNQEYIASIQRSTFREGGGEENITTETAVAVDGVNLTLHPRIAGDQIVVDYSVANSDFISLDDAGLGSGLEGVKLKTDDSLYLSNRAWLQNGQTEIIGMISESAETTSSQGLVDKALWFLGGNESRTKDRSVIIVTLTAYYNN